MKIIWFEVNTDGAETYGRNGWSKAIAIIFRSDDTHAVIESVNSKHQVTSGGIYGIPVEAMDELCKKWLEQRSEPSSA